MFIKTEFIACMWFGIKTKKKSISTKIVMERKNIQ
jgi:hypothetical protein